MWSNPHPPLRNCWWKKNDGVVLRMDTSSKLHLVYWLSVAYQPAFNKSCKILLLDVCPRKEISAYNAVFFQSSLAPSPRKLLLVTFKALNSKGPDYIIDLVHLYRPTHSLRSREPTTRRTSSVDLASPSVTFCSPTTTL